MHYDILKRVIEELLQVLPCSKADKIISCMNGGLCFRFRTGKKQLQLFVSPDRSLPRIHLISRQPVASENPSAFYLQVRKHVMGARLTNMALLGDDRVVEMRFERSGERVSIIFELFGAKANLVLADGQRKIEAVLHPTAPGVAGERILLPGMVYEPPAPRRTPFSSLKPQGLKLPEKEDLTGTAVNLAVEAWFEALLRERHDVSMRLLLRKTLERELSRVERRIDAVSRDLEVSEQSDLFRKRGEIILTNLGRISKGQDRCNVEDFDGKAISVPLDPLLTPSENAERYFRKYKKAKAGNAVLRERLDAAGSEADLLRALQQDLRECPPAELERIGALLRERGVDAAAGKSTGFRRPALSAPYRTVSFDGWDILIGKSAAGNDYITMTLAKPDDLWMHAEGMPGSHVLVRNPGKRDVPVAVVRKAASLAAFYSKGKGSTRVPIAYTDAKYVRKPKGAKPGMVVLAQRKTIMAAPEPS